MFSKLSILLVTVLAGFVAAQTSDPLCCDNVVPATSSQAQEFLDLAGIFLTNYDINIGLLCFPSDAGVCGDGTTLVGCTAPTTAPLIGVACIEV